MISTRKLSLAALALALALPASATPTGGVLEEARAALARGDGIAAEVTLERALENGATRADVAAAMGEAELLQGNLVQAREWLGPGEFAEDQRIEGFHQLARLEMLEGNFVAAADAFNKALAVGVGTAEMWVDIGRMRYASSEHDLALEAAETALKLDPEDPRALEFRGQLARDAEGLRTAIGWFARGLRYAPDDLGLLGEYAATLGEYGRAKDMLAVTRRMIELDGENSRAFFLQAVLAARAGNDELARRLLWRVGDAYDNVAAGLVLKGVLDLRAGNPGLALDSFATLARNQPDNPHAQLLLARATFEDGDYLGVVEDFGKAARRADASPYLLTLVGRAHEMLGDRAGAAPFLDRAAQEAMDGPFLLDAGPSGEMTLFRYGEDAYRIDVGVAGLRDMLATGRGAETVPVVDEFKRRYPYSADVRVLIGDVALAQGETRQAIDEYRHAARIRRSFSLVERMAFAYRKLGEDAQAEAEAADFLREHPMDPAAARLVADFALERGEWQRAALLLDHARRVGGGEHDPVLLADLSRAALEAGDVETAREAAQAAYRLQRTNGRAVYALARALRAGGNERGAGVLFAKARELGVGARPLLAAR